MNSARNKTLRDFMSKKQFEAMKGLPTFHCNCVRQTGVARPGKTARDRARRSTGL